MRNFRLSLAACCLFLLPCLVQGQATLLPRGIAPDGPIFDMARIGDTLYCGGDFDRVGYPTGGMALVPVEDSLPRLDLPFINGDVIDIVSDSSGGWYVGGDFSRVGIFDRFNLVRILATGEVDPNFDPQISGPVKALALDGNTLFVGGNFGEVNGESRKYLAALSTADASLQPFAPEPDREVLDLAIYQNALLVAGRFRQINGTDGKALVRLNKTTGASEAFPVLTAGSVQTLFLQGDLLYAGGSFPDILFSIDLVNNTRTTWAPAIGGFGFGQRVNAIALIGNTVYFGGAFGEVNGEARSNLAAVSTEGDLTPFNPDPDAEVFSLLAVGDTLLAGGDFRDLGGAEYFHIAMLDPSSGAPLPWRPRPDWAVNVMAAQGNSLLLGGEFYIFQFVERDNAFAMDLRRQEVLDWAPQTNFLTMGLVEADPARRVLYLSGFPADTSRQHIKAVDPDAGNPVPGWTVTTDREVNEIVLDPKTSNLYFAGDFTEVKGEARSRLAGLDPDGKLLPFQPEVDDEVLVMAFSETTDQLYFAGPFQTVNGTPKGKLAAVDLEGKVTDWATVIENEIPDKFNQVNAILPMADRVLLGGNFKTVNGDSIFGAAAVDPVSGARLDWDAGIEGDRIDLLFPYGKGVILKGTNLVEAGGGLVRHLAYVSAGSGFLLAEIPDVGFTISTAVTALASWENNLLVGGTFAFLDNKYHPNFAIFDLPPVEGSQFAGIEKISPAEGGNDGDVSIQLFGAGFGFGSRFYLRRDGFGDITALEGSTVQLGSTALGAVFDLRAQAAGLWDIVIEIPGDTVLTLAEAFTITEGSGPITWADLVVPPLALTGREETFYLTYGNSGNTDAHGVPLWLALSPNIEVLDLGVSWIEPDHQIEGFSDSLPNDFVPIESLNGSPYAANVWGLLIPNIPANSSALIRLTVSGTADGPFYGRAWTTAPAYGSPLEYWVDKCFDQIVEEVFGFVPFGSCAYGLFDILSKPIADYIYNPAALQDQNYAMDYIEAILETALVCAGEGATGGTAEVVKNVVDVLLFLKDSDEKKLSACYPPEIKEDEEGEFVSSLDPNDKTGLQGQGTLGWLNTQRTFPYMIRFENDPEATAPAKEVIVRDTLDISVFDLSTLSPKGFAVANSFYTFVGGRAPFATTVDLRPRLPYLLRTEIDLDLGTGELVWSFLTLDPESGQAVTDPLGGFLPPNTDSLSGQGALFFDLSTWDTLSTGRSIRNRAAIYFDFNEPIITNTWELKADNELPVSQLSPLADTQYVNTFDLSWTGSDAGAGVQYYDLLYRPHPDSSWVFWVRTAENSAPFTGEFGTYYEFRVVATDTALNQEVKSQAAEAGTFIAEKTTASREVLKEKITFFPNPVAGKLSINLPAARGETSLRLISLSGRILMQRRIQGHEKKQNLELDLSPFPPGIYFLQWKSQAGQETLKVVKGQ